MSCRPSCTAVSTREKLASKLDTFFRPPTVCGGVQGFGMGVCELGADLQQRGLDARHRLDALLLRQRKLIYMSVRAVEDDVHLDGVQSFVTLMPWWWCARTGTQALHASPAGKAERQAPAGERRHRRVFVSVHVPRCVSDALALCAAECPSVLLIPHAGAAGADAAKAD